jgi:hypothetical protein
MGEARDRKLRALNEIPPKAHERPTGTSFASTYYVVAFLDILGYRQLLKEMSGRLLEKSEDQPTLAQLQDAHGRAIRIRRDLVRHMDTFRKTATKTASNPQPARRPELRAFNQQWSKMTLGQARFSDSILFYTSLNGPAPMQTLHTMLLGCSFLQLIQLARGYKDVRDTLPLRGAIDVDYGIEVADHNAEDLEKGESPGEPQLYSAALAHAYELEQYQAEFPRIVLSNQFIHMLDSAIREQTGPEGTGRRLLASGVGRMILRDSDGVPFIDFIGPVIQSLVPRENHVKFITRAWKYVNDALNVHRKRGDLKLARKYAWLVDYIRSRLGPWGIAP